jgi:hypothetical protein
MNILPVAIKNFIDAIFSAPITFLTMIKTYLDKVSMIAGTGINLNNYFGFFNYLPTPFVQVINSLIAAILLLVILQLIMAIMKFYGQIKTWVKWW